MTPVIQFFGVVSFEDPTWQGLPRVKHSWKHPHVHGPLKMGRNPKRNLPLPTPLILRGAIPVSSRESGNDRWVCHPSGHGWWIWDSRLCRSTVSAFFGRPFWAFFWGGVRTGTVRLGGKNIELEIYIYICVGRNEIQTSNLQLYRSAKVLNF